MKELIGKTIVGMSVNEDQSILKFKTEEGFDICYAAYGDCCSESWFADITTLKPRYSMKGFPFKIEKILELEIPEWVALTFTNDGRCRQEFDEVYGYQIEADDGKILNIIYRNSSNGYYGGDCELLDTSKEWNIERLAEATWTEITGDWRA